MAARKSSYVYGSAAPKIDIQRRIEDDTPVKRLSRDAKRNRDKAARMNLGYVVFLLAAMLITSGVLIRYIRLQSDNIIMARHISELESTLNNKRLENEEEYSRVTSSVDLEKIKEVAMEELDMQYAQEGQIVAVEDAKGDYVRQYQKMP